MTQRTRRAPTVGSELPTRPNRDFPRKPTTVLVVEDIPDHVTLIKTVIKMGLAESEVHVVSTTMEARL